MHPPDVRRPPSARLPPGSLGTARPRQPSMSGGAPQPRACRSTSTGSRRSGSTAARSSGAPPPCGTRRTVKKEWQAAWLLRAITLMDLTTLSGDDTPGACAGSAPRRAGRCGRTC